MLLSKVLSIWFFKKKYVVEKLPDIPNENINEKIKVGRLTMELGRTLSLFLDREKNMTIANKVILRLAWVKQKCQRLIFPCKTTKAIQ